MLLVCISSTTSANTPPKKPVLLGETFGRINTTYNFTVLSFDPDGDKIKYAFTFDDGTNPIFSNYLSSGTAFTIQHNWSKPGVYKIMVNVKDENNAFSDTTELTVLINTRFCEYLGYFIDADNDGVYDIFVSNSSRNTTLEHFDIYLIDIDNDGVFDYRYNMSTGMLEGFYNTNNNVPSGFNYEFLVPLSFLFIIIFTASLFFVLTFKNKKYMDRKKEDYTIDFEKKKDEPTRVVEKPVSPGFLKKDFDKNLVFEENMGNNEKTKKLEEIERYIDSLKN